MNLSIKDRKINSCPMFRQKRSVFFFLLPFWQIIRHGRRQWPFFHGNHACSSSFCSKAGMFSLSFFNAFWGCKDKKKFYFTKLADLKFQIFTLPVYFSGFQQGNPRTSERWQCSPSHPENGGSGWSGRRRSYPSWGRNLQGSRILVLREWP